VEPEPYLRALAETAAQQAAVPIRVVDGTADAPPSPDAGMDAAVASLVLCSVPDQARALAELRRVLRPVASFASSSTSKPTPPAWPGLSASPTSSGPSLLAAATPAATR
jgi:ubiquinone/menaquinone biosynthesis C-methylase UbiE